MHDIRNFKKSINFCVVCFQFAVALAAISVHVRKRVLMSTFSPSLRSKAIKFNLEDWTNQGGSK